MTRALLLAFETIERRTFGAPGVRDPNALCEAFEPGEPGPRGDCSTDGHYLCDECVHRKTCAGCGKRPSRCECRTDWPSARGGSP